MAASRLADPATSAPRVSKISKKLGWILGVVSRNHRGLGSLAAGRQPYKYPIPMRSRGCPARRRFLEICVGRPNSTRRPASHTSHHGIYPMTIPCRQAHGRDLGISWTSIQSPASSPATSVVWGEEIYLKKKKTPSSQKVGQGL